MITHNSIRETDPVTHSNSYVKAINSFSRSGHRDILELLCKSHHSFHVLVSHHEISSSNKFRLLDRSSLFYEYPLITICHFYFIVAYNFLHTKHYSISDLFRIFLYSTKSNLVTFRWLLYSITIEICWNT